MLPLLGPDHMSSDVDEQIALSTQPNKRDRIRISKSAVINLEHSPKVGFTISHIIFLESHLI
jgi:hypothetical protein